MAAPEAGGGEQAIEVDALAATQQRQLGWNRIRQMPGEGIHCGHGHSHHHQVAALQQRQRIAAIPPRPAAQRVALGSPDPLQGAAPGSTADQGDPQGHRGTGAGCACHHAPHLKAGA